MAEGEGFEPPVSRAYNGFQDREGSGLGVVSLRGGVGRRGETRGGLSFVDYQLPTRKGLCGGLTVGWWWGEWAG
jgi:hypothetical protein